MSNPSRGGLFFHAHVGQVEEIVARLHARVNAADTPVLRETISLDAWLNELEELVRREVWPTMVGIGEAPDIESLEEQVEKRYECATPKQRELWSLLLSAKNLRKMLHATPPHGNAIAIQAMNIFGALSALPRSVMDGNFLSLLNTIAAQTTPAAQQENAEKGNDRAIRKRQKQKADKRKSDAGADRKKAATK